MNYLLTLFSLMLCLCSGNAMAQIHGQKNSLMNVDPSQLEGVTLKNRDSSMLVLSNVTVQKSAAKVDKAAAANQVLEPTFLQKVGNFEIHKINRHANTSDKPAQALQSVMFQGKTAPTLTETGAGQDFLGTAYLHDVQKMGLISKEIAVRFKTGSVPAQFTGLGAKELVKSSGLYVFQVNDINAWFRLLSSLQADSQVNLVEPHIVTEFDRPN